jgi:hypothetical protein
VVVHGVYTASINSAGEEAIKQAAAVLRAENKPTLYLSDLRGLTKLDHVGVRAAYKTATSLNLDRLAYVGIAPWISSILGLILRLVDVKKYQYFNDTISARKWLLGQKTKKN